MVVQKHYGIEDGMKNKNLTRTGRIGRSQFDLLRILVRGRFGTVYVAQEKGGADEGQLYAMKVVQKTLIIQQHAIKGTTAECRVLEGVGQHPFLTTLHYIFQTDSKFYLVLDYMCGGNLQTHIYGR
jgi:serine/threonine protein kinase